MRFRRRAEEATPADGASHGSSDEHVAAVFAAVLDGRRLWVAVDARPGSIALRTAAGDVVDLPDDDGSDQPAYLAARLDLTRLPADPSTYDVVLVPADGGAPRPLSTPPLPTRRTPVTPGGAARHRLERGDDGTLRLRTEPVARAAELVAASAGPDGVRLTLDRPDGPVHLLGDDGVVASWPTGLLDAAPAIGVAPQVTRVVVGDDHLPVRRRADGLADPGRGAPLPSVGRLRLRWSGQGLLQARVVDDA